MPKIKNFLIVLVAVWMLAGCSHIPLIGKDKAPAQTHTDPQNTSAKMLPDQFVDQGRILESGFLRSDLNIAVVPFTAGVEVEASDELDRAALMIVKGISDAFEQEGDGSAGKIRLVTAEDASSADYVVQGRIRGMHSPSTIKRWILMNRRKSLQVKGKMTDARTGASVLIFEDAARSSDKSVDHGQLGYRIGKNIGNFILSGKQDYLTKGQ